MNLSLFKQTICWDVLVLMILGTLGLDEQLFFVISMIYFLYLIFRNKGKTWIPKIPGIKMYLLFVVYGTLVGIFMYSFRNVLRDLYYVLPTLLWIFISYHLGIKNFYNKKNMLVTLYLYGVIVSLSCIIRFLFNLVLDFDFLRTVFGIGVYEIGFIFPIMVMDVFVNEKTIFSKIWDRVGAGVMLIHIVLSFGRIALFQPVIILFVLMLLSAKQKNEHKKVIKRIFIVFGVLMIIGVGIYFIMPEYVINAFDEKISVIYTEIDASQDFSSVGEAMNSWRAYEMQAAQNQWKDSNILTKLFGAGIGKGIRLEYVPYQWEGNISNNEIPLLHNAFYTLLPKGGLFAVFSLCLFFLGSIVKGYKRLKKNQLDEKEGIVLVATSVGAIANAYVVCGPVQQGAFLTWGILMGWINACIMKADIDDYYDRNLDTSSLYMKARQNTMQ